MSMAGNVEIANQIERRMRSMPSSGSFYLSCQYQQNIQLYVSAREPRVP